MMSWFSSGCSFVFCTDSRYKYFLVQLVTYSKTQIYIQKLINYKSIKNIIVFLYICQYIYYCHIYIYVNKNDIVFTWIESGIHTCNVIFRRQIITTAFQSLSFFLHFFFNYYYFSGIRHRGVCCNVLTV